MTNPRLRRSTFLIMEAPLSTRAENSHDVLSRKPIIEELIDKSGLTRPVVSENVFYLIIF